MLSVEEMQFIENWLKSLSQNPNWKLTGPNISCMAPILIRMNTKNSAFLKDLFLLAFNSPEGSAFPYQETLKEALILLSSQELMNIRMTKILAEEDSRAKDMLQGGVSVEKLLKIMDENLKQSYPKWLPMHELLKTPSYTLGQCGKGNNNNIEGDKKTQVNTPNQMLQRYFVAGAKQ